MKEKVLIYTTSSDQETISVGKRLGELLTAGDVIALVGELGSGKTWFAKGLALGLGVNPTTVITSPSFSLVNEYPARYPFYHMDLYRLQTLTEVFSAGLEEYIYAGGVVVVEWADRWPEIIPEWRIKGAFLISDDFHRKIHLSGDHPRSLEVLEEMERRSRPI
ncbi:MAG: tRNA (adenosine(37)-N6)-threonylcarbamoyltransferase complex ATPase subunit type 1 TsaE [Pseudomonadota bacterium]